MNRLSGMRCYLCGAIDRDPTMGRGWRHEASELLTKFGIVVLNPLNKPTKGGLEDSENINERREWKKAGQWDKLQEHMREVRQTDLRLVDMSDFLVVNINTDIHACGTYEELTWANRTKKPVLVHIEQGKGGAPDWLFGVLPHEMIFSSWEELFVYLKAVDIGIDQRTFNRWQFFDLASPTLFSLLKSAKHNDDLQDMIYEWYDAQPH